MQPSTRAPEPVPPLRPGSRIGSLKLVVDEGEQFQLRAKLGYVAFWALAAIGTGTICGYGWYGYLFNPKWDYDVIKLAGFSVVSLILAAFSISHWGLRMTVDGRRMTFATTRWIKLFASDQDLRQWKAVAIVLQPGKTGESDSCDLLFRGKEEDEDVVITRRRTDKPDSVNMILAAVRIASICGLPLEIRGASPKAHRLFSDALLQHASAADPSRQ